MDRENFYQEKSVEEDVVCTSKVHVSGAWASRRGAECPAQPWGCEMSQGAHRVFSGAVQHS